MVPNNPWCPLACRHSSPISAFIITWHPPCASLSLCLFYSPYNDSRLIQFRAHPNLLWPLLILTILQIPYFHIRSRSEVPGGCEFWGFTIQPITDPKIKLLKKKEFYILEDLQNSPMQVLQKLAKKKSSRHVSESGSWPLYWKIWRGHHRD